MVSASCMPHEMSRAPRQKPQIYPDTTATTTATTAICYGYRRKQVTRCSGYFMGAHMKYLPKQSQQGLIDSEVWETIFHGCRGRVSFQCSINKSAVVWQNEERLSVKWSSFQLTHYLINYLLVSQKIFAVRWKTNSFVDEVKEKDIAFLQGNFGNVRCSKTQKV